MRPLTTTRAIGLLAAGAMLVAACGGDAATAAPTQGPATAAPVTQATPTEVPAATTNPGATLDLSSFHGDAALEDMLPDTIGGETLTVLSMTGDQFLGAGTASPELAGALEDLGKTPADLSVAFGGTTTISVIAFRVQGVPADTLFNAFKTAQTSAYTTENVSYGGKSVVKITPTEGSIAFIYTTDETMFAIGSPGSSGSLPSDALLNEAFQKLP